MAGGFRCSSGHTWNGPAGAPTTACPVCGDTTVQFVAPPDQPVRVFVATDARSSDSTATQTLDAPAGVLTETPHAPGAPAETPNPSLFNSLVVARPESAGGSSVVEFGLDAPRPPDPGASSGAFGPPLVPGYDLLHEVGRGGMGVVYKARQVNLNRPVALKMILSGAHAGPAERERFRREAEAVAALQHPHIVQIFEIGEANGNPYLALEFVEGGSLAQNLTGEPWPVKRAAALVETLARAVQFAHDAGIVHRDLKPGNVLLAGDRGPRGAGAKSDSKVGPASGKSHLRAADAPAPKVTDFGLAKRLGDTVAGDGTRTGAVMGTPSYIAPEQASGRAREVGPAADVYALGAILYELLTGRPPFRGETPLDTVLQVLHDDPVPPKRLHPLVPNDLETICLKCLSKPPHKRYRTALELAEDLDRFLKGEPIRARPLSAWGRGVKWARRHPALAVLLGATAAATAALVLVLSVAYARVSEAVAQKDEEARNAAHERDEARKEREKAAALAAQNEERRKEAERAAERSRRAAYALQLAQCAILCERDPVRAAALLEDEARCPRELRDFTWYYLRRLCRREDREYREHGEGDPVHAVAYAPNGTFVATGGASGQVRVWDPRTGRTWLVLSGHTGTVYGVAFHPDGGALATAGADGTVRLWVLPVDVLATFRRTLTALPFVETFVPASVKTATIYPAVTLADAHAGGAACVAFAPDGRALVSGGRDGYLRWWELRGWRTAGTEAAALGGPGAVAIGLAARPGPADDPGAVPRGRAFPAHAGGVLAVSFAQTGIALASGGEDRRAKVWAADGSKLLREFADHADGVPAVALSPDGNTLATANNARPPVVRLFNVTTRRERRLYGHARAVYALAFSADGALLASAGLDRTVRLWDADDGRERSELAGHALRISGLAFAPDRRTLVSAAMDGSAFVWQTALRTHESADALRTARDAPEAAGAQQLTAAALGGTGALVAADDRGRARPLAVADPAFALAPLAWWMSGPGFTARAAAASADGRTFAVAVADAVLVWQPLAFAVPKGVPPAYSRPAVLRGPAPVHALRFDPTGRWLAAADADGVRLYDLARGPDPRGGRLVLPATDARAVAFHPARARLAVAVGTGVRVVSFDGTVIADLPDAHGATIEALAFDPTGTRLATGDASGLIKLWAARDDRPVPEQSLTGHTGRVEALAFNPNGRTLASGSADRTVVLWDPDAGRERLTLTGHADRVLDVAFSADGAGLVSVSRDGAVKRWRADPPNA